MVSKEILDTFYTLSVSDSYQRKAATQVLINIAEVTHTGSNENLYVKKRLMKGLTSNRQASRHGFSVALSTFLNKQLGKKLDLDELKTTLDTIAELTKTTRSMKRSEVKEMVLGRFFGYTAVLKAFQNCKIPDLEVNVEVGVIQFLCRMVSDLFAIVGERGWLEKACFQVIYDIVHESTRYGRMPQLIVEVLGSFDGFLRRKQEKMKTNKHDNFCLTTISELNLGLYLFTALKKEKNKVSGYMNYSVYEDLTSLFVEGNKEKVGVLCDLLVRQIMEKQISQLYLLNLVCDYFVKSFFESHTVKVEEFANVWIELIHYALANESKASLRKFSAGLIAGITLTWLFWSTFENHVEGGDICVSAKGKYQAKWWNANLNKVILVIFSESGIELLARAKTIKDDSVKHALNQFKDKFLSTAKFLTYSGNDLEFNKIPQKIIIRVLCLTNCEFDKVCGMKLVHDFLNDVVETPEDYDAFLENLWEEFGFERNQENNKRNKVLPKFLTFSVENSFCMKGKERSAFELAVIKLLCRIIHVRNKKDSTKFVLDGKFSVLSHVYETATKLELSDNRLQELLQRLLQKRFVWETNAIRTHFRISAQQHITNNSPFAFKKLSIELLTNESDFREAFSFETFMQNKALKNLIDSDSSVTNQVISIAEKEMESSSTVRISSKDFDKVNLVKTVDCLIAGLKAHFISSVFIESKPSALEDLQSFLEVIDDLATVAVNLTTDFSSTKKRQTKSMRKKRDDDDDVEKEIMIIVDSLIALLAQYPKVKNLVSLIFVILFKSGNHLIENHFPKLMQLILKNVLEAKSLQLEAEPEEDEIDSESDNENNDSEGSLENDTMDLKGSEAENVQELAEVLQMLDLPATANGNEVSSKQTEKEEYDAKLNAYIENILKAKKDRKKLKNKLKEQTYGFRMRCLHLLELLVSSKSCAIWETESRKQFVVILPLVLLHLMNKCYNSKKQFSNELEKMFHSKLQTILTMLLANKSLYLKPKILSLDLFLSKNSMMNNMFTAESINETDSTLVYLVKIAVKQLKTAKTAIISSLYFDVISFFISIFTNFELMNEGNQKYERFQEIASLFEPIFKPMFTKKSTLISWKGLESLVDKNPSFAIESVKFSLILVFEVSWVPNQLLEYFTTLKRVLTKLAKCGQELQELSNNCFNAVEELTVAFYFHHKNQIVKGDNDGMDLEKVFETKQKTTKKAMRLTDRHLKVMFQALSTLVSSLPTNDISGSGFSDDFVNLLVDGVTKGKFQNPQLITLTSSLVRLHSKVKYDEIEETLKKRRERKREKKELKKRKRNQTFNSTNLSEKTKDVTKVGNEDLQSSEMSSNVE